MGRSRKQRHGTMKDPMADGKGRAGASADSAMVPRQARTSAAHHEMMQERGIERKPRKPRAVK